jgi:hypothetical protein
MRMLKMIFVLVCVVGLTQLIWSQNGSSASERTERDTHARGIPGYLDPRTGTFTTKAQSVPGNQEGALDPTLTNYYGTYVITLTITISSNISTSDVIVCTASLSTDDPGGGLFSEDAAAVASRSGNTATCKVVIPYSWFLTTPGTDLVSIDYGADSFHLFTVGSVNQVNTIRGTHRFLGSFPVQPIGSIINLSYPARL